MQNKKGYLVTLEGGEGSGKSTQIKLLREYLINGGYDSIFTREPGGTDISEKIRDIILDAKNVEMEDETEALLYASSRVQHIKEKILPAKAKGQIVICDRYIDSSLAYQAYARGLGYDFVANANSYVFTNCMPDVTVFFDITPEEAFKRKGGADKDDRLEQSGMEFHKRVYQGYKKLADKFPERIVCIDAKKSVNDVFNELIAILKQRGIID